MSTHNIWFFVEKQEKYLSDTPVHLELWVTIKIKAESDCQTEKIEYLVSCYECWKRYVEETKGPLNLRMNCHCVR